MIPSFVFVEPWDRMNGRCRIQVGGGVFDVVRWTMPVRIVRFTARQGGNIVAEKSTFPALLRELSK